MLFKFAIILYLLFCCQFCRIRRILFIPHADTRCSDQIAPWSTHIFMSYAKQCRPRSDAADVASDQSLFCLFTYLIKNKNTTQQSLIEQSTGPIGKTSLFKYWYFNMTFKMFNQLTARLGGVHMVVYVIVIYRIHDIHLNFRSLVIFLILKYQYLKLRQYLTLRRPCNFGLWTCDRQAFS